MRPFTSTIPFDEALRVVLETATPISRTERIALTGANGRVAAADVIASIAVPPFDRAAMDGYAVRARDVAGATSDAPVALRCLDRVFTGQVPARPVTAGGCIEVATGSPMPDEADAVVMVEDTARDDDRVLVRTAAQPGQNIGRRAADIMIGQAVIRAGMHLNPSRIGALAAIGMTHVDVYARPAVAILSTGNEIVEPGAPLGPGAIYDINRFAVAAVVADHGGDAVPLPPAPDSMPALLAAIDAARACDVIVFSGGSSVGERDLMLDALRERGRVLFHGVAVKPGKPTAFGLLTGRDTPVFGLPGYPTSCLVNAYILLVPLLRRVARLPAWRPETIDVPLTRGIVSVTNRHQFYTVRLVAGGAEPAFKASGDITSMANADGFIEIPAGVGRVDAGSSIRVTLFT